MQVGDVAGLDQLVLTCSTKMGLVSALVGRSVLEGVLLERALEVEQDMGAIFEMVSCCCTTFHSSILKPAHSNTKGVYPSLATAVRIAS
jgi:hypothetical protein